MKNLSDTHLWLAFFGAIILTLHCIIREVALDRKLGAAWRALLYILVVLAIVVLSILILIQN